MQVLADVLNRPIKVSKSEQTVALGAAMFAAVAAGIYPDVQEAQRAMGAGFDVEYTPDPDRVARYQELYDRYLQFGQFVEDKT